MISPQSIAVATASAHLEGQEGRLLRATIGHSIAMAIIIGGISMLEAYVLPGLAH